MLTNDRKFRSRVTYGLAACGAGLFGEAEMEAGVIALSASPTTIAFGPFGTGSNVTLTPLNAAFFQFNFFIGKTLYAGPDNFQWAAVSQGQRIDKNVVFTPFLYTSASAAGDRLFAFRQGSHYGWIKENLGGGGGAITFLSGAYNDGTDLNNDYIDAGTLNGGTAGGGGGGFASVPEPGTTGLMGVAALAAGASALRRRRAAKAAAVASAS